MPTVSRVTSSAHLNAWFAAVRTGRRDVVRVGLNTGVSVNSRRVGLYGEEPALFSLVDHDDTLMLDLLVARGIALDATNDRGMTAMHQMAGMGNAVILLGLIGHGATVEARETNGGTPLMWASRNGHLAVIDRLLEHGSDPTLIDNDGMSSLDWAQQANATPVIQRLEQWVLHRTVTSDVPLPRPTGRARL